MSDRTEPIDDWQYALVIRAVHAGWWCELLRYRPGQGRIVWEEWLMPSSDTRRDARTVVGELWAAATELLERKTDLV